VFLRFLTWCKVREMQDEIRNLCLGSILQIAERDPHPFEQPKSRMVAATGVRCRMANKWAREKAPPLTAILVILTDIVQTKRLSNYLALVNALLRYLPSTFAIALLGIVPLLHSLLLNDPVLYPQLLGMAACAGLLAVWLLLRWKSAVELPRQVWWPLGAFVVLAAVSATWSLNAAEAGFVTARWVLVFALLIVSQIALQQWPTTLLLVCKVLIVSMSVAAIIGLLQWQGIDPLGLSDRHHSPTGVMANRNFFGSALAMGIPFAGYGFFRLPKAWRLPALVSIGLMVSGVMVSGARAASVPLLIGAAVIAPIAIWRSLQGQRRWLALLVWLVLMGLAGWSTSFSLKQKDAKIHWAYLWENGHLVTPTTSSLDFRLIGWHQTLQLAQERPLTGWGAGNWKLQIPRLGLQAFDDAENYGMVVPLHPHNEFLIICSELGIPGLLLWLAIWGMGCWGALRMALSRSGKFDNVLGACLVLAWIIFTVDASFGFPLERPLHLALFCIMLALSVRAFPLQAVSLSRLRIVLAVMIAALLFVGIDLMARLQADVAMRQVREAKANHQPQKVLQQAAHASNWAMQLDPVAALSVHWYVAMAQIELGQSEAALQAMDQAATISPHSLAVRSGQASLLDLANRSTEAIAAQTALLATFPNFSEGWLNLSIMQSHAGHWPDARRSLQKVPRAAFPERYDAVDALLKSYQY
jgi:O-antigen ligase